MTTKNATDLCAICGVLRSRHDSNHKFSENGELEVVEPTRPRRSAAVSGIDIPLRLLLIDKGVITAEDLAVKEAQLRDKLRGESSPG